jgi:two-component system sensor histidine kinase AlgZ
MYQQSVMRKPSILSTTPPIRRDPSPSARGKKGDAPRPGALLFDACEIGVVLRAVLLVEAVVAVVMLFLAPTPTAWLVLTGSATAGAVPATMHWLVAACATKTLVARLSHRTQFMAGVAMGALSAIYGCALLRLSGVMESAPWFASAMSGGMLAAVFMSLLVLRARGRLPAATTARLQELQARIRPHFLFNTLNSAIALVREDPVKAETMLEDLSELFRGALAEPGDSVTLADEILLARRYLAIEQVRFDARLTILWDIDPAADGARLPPLLLQPLVENSVKHGIEPSPEGGMLLVRTQRRGGLAVIEVVNTLAPPPWNATARSDGNGIALDNVRDRLRLLHDVQAQFAAGIDKNNYRVRIAVPIGT